MTDSYFAIRSRFREVRWAVRQSKELLQPSKDGNLIFRFLEDLALSIQLRTLRFGKSVQEHSSVNASFIFSERIHKDLADHP